MQAGFSDAQGTQWEESIYRECEHPKWTCLPRDGGGGAGGVDISSSDLYFSLLPW